METKEPEDEGKVDGMDYLEDAGGRVAGSKSRSVTMASAGLTDVTGEETREE